MDYTDLSIEQAVNKAVALHKCPQHYWHVLADPFGDATFTCYHCNYRILITPDMRQHLRHVGWIQ